MGHATMSRLRWGGHYTLDPVRATSHQLKRRETARDGARRRETARDGARRRETGATAAAASAAAANVSADQVASPKSNVWSGIGQTLCCVTGPPASNGAASAEYDR